eukprot:CAMPEP_0180191240 /NCGR_PEP_ID=MMETSP0987-20121128/1318_1 /TAXON_ID=697907 /ORGANISM="non described non described, Strain CCMP2293" /LENGTH=36 /DNA_ID= /DNA_START= /DNA_END= /DNA_ORIENTATION=
MRLAFAQYLSRGFIAPPVGAAAEGAEGAERPAGAAR